MENCRTICKTRDHTARELQKLGFSVLPSASNFLFAKTEAMGGEELYRELKDRGILVRYFAAPRTRDYIRVTIGTDAQMERFLAEVREILERKQENP